MKDSSEWRCSECDKKLGTIENNRVHIRIRKEHQYIVSLPVVSVCRCKALNELSIPHPGSRRPTHS